MARMFDWKKEKLPPPGSAKAQTLDCICPVLDNHYGKGINGAWWVTGGCPVHDPKGVDDNDVLNTTE